ncbi:hypothetical protein [Xanthomonas bonasiae]|uniref:hypothetical protein n=1 Tax=Xanthomonas bonasiae TaxID=2810351 RepID=UPI0017828028|nr:hypothetical protein [Xanthomonas surreyensis]
MARYGRCTMVGWMLFLAALGGVHACAQAAASGGAADAMAGFPVVPAGMPQPWRPFEVERQLGAVCVDGEQARARAPALLLRDAYCRGPAPAHMARALLGIPSDALTMSQDARTAGLRDAIYLAAPGQGRRPDFTVVVGDIKIRSFESPDPQKTVYLVWSVRCGAGDAGMACSAGTGYKAFRLGADGAAYDVSAEVLPRDPVLTAADRARQEKHGGNDMYLLPNKLPYVATLRWLMEFDPDQPLAKSDPRRADSYAHFGFVRWTGERFERVARVPRAQWPCQPMPPDEAGCLHPPDTGADRFVVEQP